MKVKKFVAPTMPEAMNTIRKELGPEAVILNSKEVSKGGFLGLFKKRSIEVVAALDPSPKPPPKNDKKPTRQPIPFKPASTDGDVLSEVRQLRKVIELQTADGADYPTDYQVIYRHLLSQEIEETLAHDLMDALVQKHKASDTLLTDHNAILLEIRAEIEERFQNRGVGGFAERKRLIQFVGPTGAGKTTTIAKVAASRMMHDHKRVAFITADTYRIAAVEQLKTYANILNVPLEVVYNSDDYNEAIQKYASYDLILVDTAGRNFREEKYVRDLEKTIAFNDETETCLVLSLTAKASDLAKIYDQFKHLPIQNVIFTKMDETRQYGSILNITLNNNLGVAYLTNGQDVPDDILKPTPQVVSGLIAGEQNDT
ncbi:flagellar biosynthesis protein FlhF [Lentibacillus persicus]|uniref:Flagellar biosynthesis protein FlhF n=1 Tax=Lentibacillus persicus TaxID=640948 RepID=A0A1I1VIC0_9BACI|nr:flagellar biosynthesis protein FlhF [Lentibacillus persicus]SFD80220.1 flagellar biosynthesis protein FlhF [Lentibacillus persicus]